LLPAVNYHYSYYYACVLQFNAEKWKLDSGSQVYLYSLSTHLPVRVKAGGVIDACGDFSDPLGLLSQLVSLYLVMKPSQLQFNRPK